MKLREDGTLSVSSQQSADHVIVITLRGEIDYSSAPRLREAISRALASEPAPKAVLVDMAAVTMLDSTGLGTLVVGYRICAEMGVRLVVRDPSPFVTRLLAVTGLESKLAPPRSASI